VRAKRIVQVSAYYPPHLGGQENAVHDLAVQLADAGHTVEVLTSTAGGGTSGVSQEDGVQVKRLWGFAVGHAPILPLFPVALFRAAKPDSVVHVHIGQAFTPEMVWLVSKLRHFKYIAHLHIDFQPSGPMGVLLPLYKRFVLKYVLQGATCVVALNKKTLQTVRESYGYTGQAVVMNNGLDDAYFLLERKRFTQEPPSPLRLLFVGRLSKQKNVSTLLEALKITDRQVYVDIIGDGPEYSLLKKMITENHLANVSLHGRLERNEITEFYKTCDALIMPSLYEAQPLVLLEAMAARIPIIGARVIGIEDHLRDGGILVNPTAEGLANGIEQYYKQYRLLPELVERAYSNAAALRWPHTLKKYEALYEEVLGA
jgi:glycosyltransferase involved in cell wall biosynthesis